MSSPRSPRFISTCRSHHLNDGLKLSADCHARATTLFAKRAPNVVGVSPANARRLSPSLRQTTSPTLTADSAGNGKTQHTSRSLDGDDARLDGDGDTLRDHERALVVNRHRHRARHKKRIWRRREREHREERRRPPCPEESTSKAKQGDTGSEDPRVSETPNYILFIVP